MRWTLIVAAVILAGCAQIDQSDSVRTDTDVPTSQTTDEPAPAEPAICDPEDEPRKVNDRRKVVPVWFICEATGEPTKSHRVSNRNDPRTGLDFVSIGPTRAERRAGLVSYVPRGLTSTYGIDRSLSTDSISHWDFGPTWLSNVSKRNQLPAVHQLLANVGLNDFNSFTDQVDLGCLNALGCGIWQLNHGGYERITCDSPDVPGWSVHLEVVAEADLDHDGRTDVVETWDLPADHVRFPGKFMRISFADGSATHPHVLRGEFLGHIDLDGDGLDEFWIYSGGGSAHSAELYRIDDCVIRPVNHSSGDRFSPLFDGTGNAAAWSVFGVRCDNEQVVVTFSGPVDFDVNQPGQPKEFAYNVRTYELIEHEMHLTELDEGINDQWDEPTLGPFGFTCPAT